MLDSPLPNLAMNTCSVLVEGLSPLSQLSIRYRWSESGLSKSKFDGRESIVPPPENKRTSRTPTWRSLQDPMIQFRHILKLPQCPRVITCFFIFFILLWSNSFWPPKNHPPAKPPCYCCPGGLGQHPHQTILGICRANDFHGHDLGARLEKTPMPGPLFGGKKVRGKNIDRFLSRVFVRGCVSIKWHIMGYDREMWVWLGLPHQDLVKFKKTWEVLTSKKIVVEITSENRNVA